MEEFHASLMSSGVMDNKAGGEAVTETILPSLETRVRSNNIGSLKSVNWAKKLTCLCNF